ncbi:P-loop containing nucleoside triphosphate hydrolase protein [Pilobolus umbonatus]|nr:P-loop containing nucleoside triphosphate hydrolase protein [Pilobolus umbonatus]
MVLSTQESLSHILHHYFKYKEDRERRQLPSRPMVVGLSGCQGSGKTTLSDTVVHLLKESPYQLNVVNFSMDDVYLTRIEQVKLTQKYPTNPFYQHRGQAGSHDLDLLQHTLDALTEKGTVAIPAYDKSMHEGQGDRVDREEWRRVRAPVDIVLLEGWMLGFKPLEEDGLVETYHELNLVYKGVTLEDVRVMNGRLREYEDRIYPYFDIFIHLSPLQLQQVYEWRLQQEHHMKSTRGVGGLSDERVRTFVDSYMPAYQLYLPSLDKVGFYSQCRNTLKPYEGLNRMDRGQYTDTPYSIQTLSTHSPSPPLSLQTPSQSSNNTPQ